MVTVRLYSLHPIQLAALFKRVTAGLNQCLTAQVGVPPALSHPVHSRSPPSSIAHRSLPSPSPCLTCALCSVQHPPRH